ncbi:diaminopimelate decarboxylase [Candidatus Bathyarchaeota archaeon]|nr:diaminopimelate decarboxylase [Candidatus Bathyarchaeota archaeon]
MVITLNLDEWYKHKHLSWKGGKLHFVGQDVTSLSKRYGTPLYVTSQDIIEQRYDELHAALRSQYDKIRIHYAVKANSNPAVLKILKDKDARADCVSIGEIQHCLKAGFEPSRILYTGNNQTHEQLKFAFEQGVNVNLDSISQVKTLASMLEEETRAKLPLISFRINPEIGAGHHEHCITAGRNVKFGILDEQVEEAYRKALDVGFSRFGIQTHIGSGILDVDAFKKAGSRYLEIVSSLHAKLGINFEFIDFGGGIGIPYKPSEDPLDLDKYAETMIGLFKEACETGGLGTPNFCVEPGRYIVGESTILVVQINTIKVTPYKQFAGVNAGFNTLVRPAMYGSYHHVITCTRDTGDGNNRKATYDIVGQICESGDILAKERELPILNEGDYLVLLDAGAYGFSMASEYNSNPLPAEVLIRGSDAALTRERQTFQDLLRHVKIPPWLK